MSFSGTFPLLMGWRCSTAQHHTDFHEPVLNEAGPISSALLSHSVSDADDNSLSVLRRHSYFSPEFVSNSSFCSYNSYLSHRSKRRFALALACCSLHKYPSPTPPFSMLLWIALFSHANSSKTQPLVQLQVITCSSPQSQQTHFPLC